MSQGCRSSRIDGNRCANSLAFECNSFFDISGQLSQGEAKDEINHRKNEKDLKDCFSLREVLDYIQDNAKKGMHIQWYKGLGEMNAQQLWDTTMDPERRTLLQVALEDTVEADKTFTMLMGDEVAPRREFIETNAHMVKDLDI